METETAFLALFDFHPNGVLVCLVFFTLVSLKYPLEFRVVLVEVLVCPLPFFLLFAQDCI